MMKCTLALGAVAVVLAAATSPAARAADTDRPQLSHSVHTDITARKKKVVYRSYRDDPTRSPYYLRPGVAPSFGYIGPPGYAGEYAWRKSIGQCVVDLGYGRWAACDSR